MAAPVVLVTMPWQSLESPSLPIGLLKASVARAGMPSPTGYYANLRWIEFLLDRTDGEVGPPEYTTVAEEGLFDALGDWVFAGVLHDDDDFGVETLQRYAREHHIDISVVTRMRAHAADFVDAVVADVLALGPAIVGFTTTFMQNVPSLAAAKRLKQLAPDVLIVFGGGNCDGVMGAALHRNYRCVDLVVRGEGEVAFPALLQALATGGDLAAVPGLCWWDAAGTQRLNRQPAPLPSGQIPMPDFDDWFEDLEASAVNEYIEPKLVVETARGCWWGEKHHCTFCGLNGTLMEFRAKTPDTVMAELTELIRRHRTLDVIVVDNIIDNRYFTDVLPRVADLGWDLRIHYEVKSNLTPAQVETLRRARVAHVQPGIESLVSPVLKLMDKGVAGVRNVRALRDCESAGLTVSWNWLYGFPGETPEHYAPVLGQIRALVHLQPPVGAARILLERFSPYFENTALGFGQRTTAEAYRHVYALPESDLSDMVYLFDTVALGLTEADAASLRTSVARWNDDYADSTLECRDESDALVLRDRRVGWPQRDIRIEEPRWRIAYDALRHGHSVPALARLLAEAGEEVPANVLDTWLAEMAEQGFLFTENGQWISLATDGSPVKVA
jgi:ribosomal peptide maturation radical SAM protein 1